MRVVALDVGWKTIGVAVSDELGLTAQPVRTLARLSVRDDAAAVARLLDELGATELVVGLPVRTDGTEGDSARRARQVGDAVALLRPALPSVYRDESYTTVVAERSLDRSGVRGRRRKALVDTVAAQVLLQDHLDERRGVPPGASDPP